MAQGILRAVQVLLSSKGVFALFRAGEWEAEQRLSHCSRPEESLSIVTVGTACDRLGQQMKNLGTEPVLPGRSQASLLITRPCHHDMRHHLFYLKSPCAKVNIPTILLKSTRDACIVLVMCPELGMSLTAGAACAGEGCASSG